MGWNHQPVMRATRHGQDSEILGGSSDADLAVSDDSEEPVGAHERRVQEENLEMVGASLGGFRIHPWRLTWKGLEDHFPF